LSVAVSDGRGRAVRDGGLARWLTQVAPSSVRGELAIALVSDARMRSLNRRYRRKDQATDVLSFASEQTPSSQAPGSRLPASGFRLPHPASRIPHPASRDLGDLVIASGVARRQAREAGHSYQTELRVLALHGLLHLLGYDHEGPDDSGRMMRAEVRLRRKGGLTAGLIQRATGEPAGVARTTVRRRSRSH
jgi:probable rRNA maturation factor